MAIQGKSYYKTEGDVTNQVIINYGFTALTAADITVFAYTGDGIRITLTQGSVSDYDVDLENNLILCNYDTWYDVPSLSNEAIDYLRIYRTTTTQELVDFTEGAVLSENDLETAYRQGLFAAQEVSEDASDTSPNGVQAVGTAQLDNLAVTSDKLAVGSVTNSKLAVGSVTNSKIASNAITSVKIADNAVTTDAILNDAVTVDKLADNAVETDKIKDDAVTYDKVAPATKLQMQGQLAAGVVTPDVLKNSPFSPRCYGTVTYDVSTDQNANPPTFPTVSGGFNVASVTEDTEDERTITFTEALAGSDYTVLVSQQVDATGALRYPFVVRKGTAGFTIRGNNGDVAGHSLNFVVFGSTYPDP